MTTQTNKSADVLVVGGGTSGCIAAIAAARTGVDTLLVERYGFLGGTSTFVSAIHGFMDGHGNLVVRGIPGEMMERLVEEGGSTGYLRNMKWGPGAPPGVEYSSINHDNELIKYVLIMMCEEAGVRLLLHTFFDHAITDPASADKVIGAKVLTKSGQRELLADVVVDGTGDGDVAASAGAQFDCGDSKGQVQNVTLMFRVGNVDLDRALAALKAGHPALQGWGTWHNKVKIGLRLGETEPSVLGFQAQVSARLGGEKDAKRTIILGCNATRKGEAILNVTRTTGIDPTSPEDLTRAEVEQRKKVVAAVKALREERVPGFENCYIIATAPQVGIRESRRIIGEYTLTKEDVVEGQKFADCIAKGAYPVDIHDPKGGPHAFTFIRDGDSYDIPYRCLVPKRVDGLLVAGRAVSCDHDALGSLRNQATVAAIGHAAGTAAALAAREGITPRHVDVLRLRRVLAEQGACVESAPPAEPRTPTA